MSRSYKKTPWCGDHKGTQKKRQAWKKVRQWQKDNPDILLQGGAYKKIYETWDICDYGWVTTWEEYWRSCWEWYYYALEHYSNSTKNKKPDQKEEYRHWYKYHKGK